MIKVAGWAKVEGYEEWFIGVNLKNWANSRLRIGPAFRGLN